MSSHPIKPGASGGSSSSSSSSSQSSSPETVITLKRTTSSSQSSTSAPIATATYNTNSNSVTSSSGGGIGSGVGASQGKGSVQLTQKSKQQIVMSSGKGPIHVSFEEDNGKITFRVVFLNIRYKGTVEGLTLEDLQHTAHVETRIRNIVQNALDDVAATITSSGLSPEQRAAVRLKSFSEAGVEIQRKGMHKPEIVELPANPQRMSEFTKANPNYKGCAKTASKVNVYHDAFLETLEQSAPPQLAQEIQQKRMTETAKPAKQVRELPYDQKKKMLGELVEYAKSQTGEDLLSCLAEFKVQVAAMNPNDQLLFCKLFYATMEGEKNKAWMLPSLKEFLDSCITDEQKRNEFTVKSPGTIARPKEPSEEAALLQQMDHLQNLTADQLAEAMNPTSTESAEGSEQTNEAFIRENKGIIQNALRGVFFAGPRQLENFEGVFGSIKNFLQRQASGNQLEFAYFIYDQVSALYDAEGENSGLPRKQLLLDRTRVFLGNCIHKKSEFLDRYRDYGTLQESATSTATRTTTTTTTRSRAATPEDQFMAAFDRIENSSVSSSSTSSSSVSKPKKEGKDD